MISEEEVWTMHGLEVIERSTKHEIVWKQFVKAIRVKNLTKYYEATLEFLKDLRFNSSFPEYQAILGYLSYWSGSFLLLETYDRTTLCQCSCYSSENRPILHPSLIQVLKKAEKECINNFAGKLCI